VLVLTNHWPRARYSGLRLDCESGGYIRVNDFFSSKQNVSRVHDGWLHAIFLEGLSMAQYFKFYGIVVPVAGAEDILVASGVGGTNAIRAGAVRETWADSGERPKRRKGGETGTGTRRKGGIKSV
jgi:hypothetical protein